MLQVLDVMQHGYGHARSVDYTGTGTACLIEWLRMPRGSRFHRFRCRFAGDRGDQVLARSGRGEDLI
jgi:hypothetical protein